MFDEHASISTAPWILSSVRFSVEHHVNPFLTLRHQDEKLVCREIEIGPRVQFDVESYPRPEQVRISVVQRYSKNRGKLRGEPDIIEIRQTR